MGGGGGAEEEQRRAEQKQSRSRGGAEEKQRRSRGGAEEERRRSRGGAEHEPSLGAYILPCIVISDSILVFHIVGGCTVREQQTIALLAICSASIECACVPTQQILAAISDSRRRQHILRAT